MSSSSDKSDISSFNQSHLAKCPVFPGIMFILVMFISTFGLVINCITKFFLQGRSEKAMAPHSSTLAWKIPWMEEPSRLQSMGSGRVGHDRATSLSLFTFMHWRRKWQPTPVFFPGESQGRGSLVGCHLWGCTESDTTEATQQQQQHREDKMPVWNGDPELMPDLMEILLTLEACPMGSNSKYQPCPSTSIIKRMLQFIPLKPMS